MAHPRRRVPDDVYDKIAELGGGSAERGWARARDLLDQLRPEDYLAGRFAATLAQASQGGPAEQRVHLALNNLPALVRLVGQGKMNPHEVGEAVSAMIGKQRGFVVRARTQLAWKDAGEGTQAAVEP